MGRLPLVCVASLVLLQSACGVQAFLLPSPASSKGITPRHVKLGSPSSFLRPLTTTTRRRARDFDDEEEDDDTPRGPPPRRRRPPMRRSDNDEDEEEDGDEGSLYSVRGGAGGGRGGGRRGGGGGGRGMDEDEAWSMRPGALDRPRPQPVRRPEVRKNRLPFGIPWIPQGLSAALLMGTFVVGVGTGVTIDSAINTNPKDLASRDAIDKNAPNPKFCQRYGASALVLDHRIFVSFNPFSVFATQADVKPGCVLRAANVVQALQGRGLLTDEDVNTCKNGNNTYAYVGDINDKPQLSCVYQSDDAQNEFVSNPKIGLGEDYLDK